MIQEELYVIKNGERFKLDLNTPSGITLNYKSNIFGDLSKITCSYSYTFRLPLTLNNRIVFESAEDIRTDSKMVRKKLTAEFIQNGIKLFDDANLYIDVIDGSFNAVMTWGVVRGLETLKDNDLSLREILYRDISTIARYGIKTTVPRPTSWRADVDYFIPWRKNDTAYLEQGYKSYVFKRDTGSGDLPVIPLWQIIQAINDNYGTTFDFGTKFIGYDHWNSTTHHYDNVTGEYLMNFGVIPLVKRDLTDAQYADRTGILKNVQVINNSFWGIALPVWDNFTAHNVISFDYQKPVINDYYEIGNNGSSSTRKWTFYKKSTALLESVSMDGHIKVVMNNIGRRWKNNKCEFERSDIIPKLVVCHRTFKLKEGSDTNGEIVYDEVASIEGKYLGPQIVIDGAYTYEYFVFDFDFRQSEGRSPLKIEDFTSHETYPFFMYINDDVRSVEEVSEFKIIPSGRMSNNINSGWEIDIPSNLPDVSCLSLIKSLYYMIGAFPIVNKDGYIVPLYYSDLYRQMNTVDSLDWSNKLVKDDSTLPDKVSFSVSGFGQKNYYLMNNDDLEKKQDSTEDIYEAGMGCIVCDNETIEKSKTIIQIPFYGAFLNDASRPSAKVGGDMKYKKFKDDDTTEFVEAKPAIGTVRAVEEFDYQTPITDPPTIIPKGTYTMVLDIWDGFSRIDEIGSYDALQCIIKDPVIITENVNLDEFDLRDIDYSKPVYLRKYNAYFAIVSITRDSKGVCKCEFIKIP